MAQAFLGPELPQTVSASVTRTAFQSAKPPFLAQAILSYDAAQARIGFNAHTTWGQEDRTVISGDRGTLRCFGPSFNNQSVGLWTADGHCRPPLDGCWFDNGFQGTMCELLCAIEQGREPANAARQNLASLAVCFAAVASADSGAPVAPNSVQRLTTT